MATLTLTQSYHYCERYAQNHHEFFPIASKLLPKKLRRPISVIYTFARTADDIADEGNASQSERLQQLDALWHSLETLEHPSEPLFIALKDTSQRHRLPLSCFYNLLTAFKQDVVKHDYEHTQAVYEYARYSANPVGRLLLHLTEYDSDENLLYSDALCTAFQLINFYRDIHSDLQNRQRCYLPLDQLSAFELTLEDLRAQQHPEQLNRLVSKLLEEAQDLIDQGKPLTQQLKGVFGFEIQLIVAHNQYMLDKLRKRKNPYHSIKITAWEWLLLFLKTLFRQK